jgi:hypothetical protein
MQPSTFCRAADAISETLILQARNAIPSNAANRRCSGRRHRAIDSRFDFEDRRQARRGRDTKRTSTLETQLREPNAASFEESRAPI